MTLARNFFTAAEQERLLAAIHEAELHTSGEIRLHIENLCFGDPVRSAQRMFAKLGMHGTKERNGVLIYIATISHKVAIIGDQGIHEKLGSGFWEKMANDLISEFRAHHQADALARCIVECGKQLGNYFPRSAEDSNELSNTISF
jgi:uncharacterized membrane protein